MGCSGLEESIDGSALIAPHICGAACTELHLLFLFYFCYSVSCRTAGLPLPRSDICLASWAALAAQTAVAVNRGGCVYVLEPHGQMGPERFVGKAKTVPFVEK